MGYTPKHRAATPPRLELPRAAATTATLTTALAASAFLNSGTASAADDHTWNALSQCESGGEPSRRTHVVQVWLSLVELGRPVVSSYPAGRWVRLLGADEVWPDARAGREHRQPGDGERRQHRDGTEGERLLPGGALDAVTEREVRRSGQQPEPDRQQRPGRDRQRGLDPLRPAQQTGETPISCNDTTSRRRLTARSMAATAKASSPMLKMTAAIAQTMARSPAAKSSSANAM